MSEDYFPEDKADLLDVIRRERQNLDSLIDSLTQDQKCTLGVEASWSVKDLMAHIAAWERLALDRIHAALTGEPIKIPIIEGDNFVDDFNGEVYSRNRYEPLESVEEEYKGSYADFLVQIENLGWDFIQAVLPFEWAGDLTALVLISSNSHWHYKEHAASIRKKIEG